MAEESQLEAIRARPGMYIGNTGPRGRSHLLLEVVANSVDQALQGFATRIRVELEADGSATVTDDGAGFRTDEGFLTRVFLEFSDQPTVDGHIPHVHISGTGGGLALVAALCELVEVTTTREGFTTTQSFSRGVPTTPPQTRPAVPGERGTSVRLLPDPEIFEPGAWLYNELAARLEEVAVLQPGLSVTLRVPERTFGPQDQFTRLMPHHPHDPALVMNGATPTGSARIALAWRTYGPHEPAFYSYCNFRRIEDGKQLDGVEEGLRRVFGHAPMTGICGAVSVIFADPDYVGPTKMTLTSPQAAEIVAAVIAEQLPGQLAANPELEARLRAMAAEAP